MYREGYALVLSGGISSVLGLVYWIVAARSYDPRALGVNSAMISAMMFLAGVSQLSLASASVRFLPAAGAATRRFVMVVYLLTLGGALLVSIVFLIGVGIWTPTLSFLRSSLGFAVTFTVAVMAWGAFNLQHSILTGLRRAIWVPVENATYSVSKLGLVVVFAPLLSQWGIFASWTIGLAPALLPMVALIFGWLIPRHMERTRPEAAAPTRANVVRYVAGDYVGGLCWLASTTLVPIMVFERAGAAANAYFALSWAMVLPLYTIGANMGSSLVVSAVFERARLKALSYRMLLQTLVLVVPLATVLIIGAPYVLRVFGEGYAANGTPVLRLLAVATIPGTVNILYISVARVQRRMSRVAMVFAGQSLLVLGLAWLLVSPFGVAGVGLAWVVSQLVVAVVVLLAELSGFRSAPVSRTKQAEDC
jgi:O-antigen/teichoic acid export membrane protein